jgi:hypothetical protein
MRRAVWLLVVALLALFAPQAAAQEAAEPMHYYVIVAGPNVSPRVLFCDEDVSDEGIPGQPDIDAVTAAGQWFIGLDVGAHQARYKLICVPGDQR